MLFPASPDGSSDAEEEKFVESIHRAVMPTGRRPRLPPEMCGLVVTAEGEEQVSGRHLPSLLLKSGFRVAGRVTREIQL